MSIPAVARSALLDAMAQFNRELRDTPEWVGWEQNKAHLYAIEHEGNRYPVKQIVSMATGLPVWEFSGGRAPGDANAFAVDRGFEVTELRSGRNPTWVRDELILALDAYLSFSGNPPDKDSPEIVGLSTILNRLAQYLGLTKAERFRNANGVYMKLMNFRRFDPVFTGAGKVGLSRGGKAEEEVWHEFAHNPARCHAVAETIRIALENIQEDETITDLLDGDIEEAEEGRVITALHRRYERDKRIVQKAKKRMLAILGHLTCEACGFDFRERYGEHGQGFIECHHARPVHTLKLGEKTKISDLRLLCANCHRMIHAKRQWVEHGGVDGNPKNTRSSALPSRVSHPAQDASTGPQKPP